MLLEICSADIESVKSAAAGGADRVELCSGLSEGGVTPSCGFIREALKIEGIKVHVLIRPRAGNFTFTPEEVDAMIADIEFCNNAGVHGVVIGALTAEGRVDKEACRRMMQAAQGMSVTFHRAFDVAADPAEALADIIELGCNRILTSGGAPKAIDGVEELKKMVELADDKLSIIAASGVNPGNAADIIASTGVKELHASASIPVASNVGYRSEHKFTDEYCRKTSSVDTIIQLSNIVHK